MPGGEAATALSYQGNIVIPTQAESSAVTASNPAAGATVTSLSVSPGEYTVSWETGLEGTTPGAADANNMGLYAGGTLLLTSVNPGSAGSYQQLPIVVTTQAGVALSVKVIAAVTTGATYSASISATPVPTVSPDDPLYPYNPLTADGQSVNITSTPANLATTLNGFDLSAQAECQVGRGNNVPSGTSDFGFVDTTYTVTQAQILTTPGGQPGSGQYNW